MGVRGAMNLHGGVGGYEPAWGCGGLTTVLGSPPSQLFPHILRVMWSGQCGCKAAQEVVIAGGHTSMTPPIGSATQPFDVMHPLLGGGAGEERWGRTYQHIHTYSYINTCIQTQHRYNMHIRNTHTHTHTLTHCSTSHSWIPLPTTWKESLCVPKHNIELTHVSIVVLPWQPCAYESGPRPELCDQQQLANDGQGRDRGTCRCVAAALSHPKGRGGGEEEG